MTPRTQKAVDFLMRIIREEYPESDTSKIKNRITSLLPCTDEEKNATLNSLKTDIAKYYKTTVKAIDSRSKEVKKHVNPRQACYVVAYFLFKESFPKTGAMFNRRECTIFQSVKKICGLMQVDSSFNQENSEIFKKFGILEDVMNYKK